MKKSLNSSLRSEGVSPPTSLASQIRTAAFSLILMARIMSERAAPDPTLNALCRTLSSYRFKLLSGISGGRRLDTSLDTARFDASPSAQPVRWLPLPGPAWSSTMVCLVAFDLNRFTPQLFRWSDIDYPPSVMQSVFKRQAEFFFGRLTARMAMQAIGRKAVDIAIGSAGEPAWPPGLIGSISHSSQIAAAVVLERGNWRGVGIDLEAVVTDEVRPAVLASAVSEDEASVLISAGLPCDTAITIVFSAKESLFKGAFGEVGRFFDFAAARLRSADATSGRLVFDIEETLSAGLLPGVQCELFFRMLDPHTVLTSFLY